MKSLLDAFWLNPKNDKFVDVVRHEISAQDKNDQKKLGLSKPQKVALDLVKGSEDKIRMKAVKLGLVRIRDYSNAVHVQFYAERGRVRNILDSLFMLIRKTTLKNSWNIQIENMHPTAKDFVSMSMDDFKKAINSGETIMREGKK